MKPFVPAAIAVMAGLAALAEEPGAAGVTSTNRPVTSSSAVPVPGPDPGPSVPVVRIPVPPAAETSGSAGTRGGAGSGVDGSKAQDGSAGGSGGAELGWRSDGVVLRAPAEISTSPIQTNRTFEPRGVIPRLVRPERRGFGGFVAGFANLFNPFAPVSQGVAVSETHWYDAQINPAPLPRAFRDERTHEPKIELFRLDLDGPGTPAPEPKAAPRGVPPP